METTPLKLEEKRKQQLKNVCQSLMIDYLECLNKQDIEKIKKILERINESNKIENLENKILPIVEKIWDAELSSGKYLIISWYKHTTDELPQKIVTYATISEKDNIIQFCDLRLGVIYKINYKSIIGALNRDGATVVEDIDKKNKYTIGIIGDKVINSYNGATKLITPKQLINPINNSIQTKHNELILDNRYISVIGTYEVPLEYRKCI